MPVFIICGAASEDGFQFCGISGKHSSKTPHEWVERQADITARELAALEAELAAERARPFKRACSCCGGARWGVGFYSGRVSCSYCAETGWETVLQDGTVLRENGQRIEKRAAPDEHPADHKARVKAITEAHIEKYRGAWEKLSDA